ncbi:hypothetical protein C5167_015919 [Papaver somniferum]|nr:hypothetical protein C5167_015919 [Papaver somniferum]
MSSCDAYLQFICLYIFVSSHPPSWSTQDKIQLGFFVFGIILNLCNQFIIRPKKYEAVDEKYDLEAEMFKILGNDTTGWSKKLVEKKKHKIAALRKKIEERLLRILVDEVGPYMTTAANPNIE